MVSTSQKLRVIGACVRGAAHKHSGKPCQDNIKVKTVRKKETYTVLAVADGHGSDKSPFSDEGSKIAVDVFHTVTGKYFRKYKSSAYRLGEFLKREGGAAFAREIEKEWKRRIKSAHRANNRETPDEMSDISESAFGLWQKYGSTLLGLIVAPAFYFAFRIGDGDAVLLTASENGGGVTAEHMIQCDKILGVETHSLCLDDAWKKAASEVKPRPDGGHAFMLSTDGLSNSYPDEEAFLRTCREYYAAVEEHGANAVWGKLNAWLEETSEYGSGDDISVLIACDYGL